MSIRLWNADNGRSGLQIWQFSYDDQAVTCLDENRIIKVTGDTWRWLGWSGIDPATGRIERWPAEIFGELPE